MAGADPVTKSETVSAALGQTKNLTLRIISSAVLAPLAIAAAYFGGWPFRLFWIAAAIGVFYEWMQLVAQPSDGFALRRPGWIMAGIVYSALLMAAPVLLREDAEYGFIAILMLFAIVWGTDIVGYFVGRAVGGPKLAPAISPNKTWSGAIAGAIAAIAGAIMVVVYSGLRPSLTLAMISLVLSACSQAGDLLESKLKRMFGAKDAGSLIPGHGGLMDRLDGFWAAAVAAALFGVLRGGLNSPAHGILVW